MSQSQITHSTSILERAKLKIKDLEQQLANHDYSKQSHKSLLDSSKTLEDVKAIFNNRLISNEEKQNKLYQKLIQLVYENKRIDRDIEENRKKLKRNISQLKKCESDITTLKDKLETSSKYLSDIIVSNEKAEKENEKMEQAINEKNQLYLLLFNKTLDSLLKRLKDYVEDQETKGKPLTHKYSNLEQIAYDEQRKILELNAEIAQITKNVKEYQNQYKEIVKQELGDLNDQKVHYKQRWETSKGALKELNVQLEDFKKRFIMQSKQMHRNKDIQRYLEKELYRVIEQKNYLEKENQELSKTKENQLLIYQNLSEEVGCVKKENQDMVDKKKLFEEFIMKYLK